MGIFKNITKTLKKAAPLIGSAIGMYFGGPVGASIGSGIGSLAAGKDDVLGASALGIAEPGHLITLLILLGANFACANVVLLSHYCCP